MRRGSVSRFLRRSVAVCAAGIGVWLLLTTPTAWGVAAHVRSAGFATAALRSELGWADSPLPFWQRLAAEQSPLLEHNLTAEAAPVPAASGEPLPDAQPAPDRDEQTEGESGEAPAARGEIVERTLVPTSGAGYVTGAGLYLYNRTDLEVDLAGALAQPLEFTLRPGEEGPQILIVHTHTTEAYTPDGEDVYTPSDNNTRTLEEEYNMLRVGDEMERVFTSMGLSVIHDRGVYDYPFYAGAYSRSGAAVREYLEKYPTLRLVLDVHRDALTGSDGTVYKACTEVDTVKTAQVMLVVGSSGGGGDHPRWEQNLALAAKLQRSLDTLYPTLARPMALRKSVYNQDLSVGSLLVEVGCHGNTLREALAGARDFARSAGAVFLTLVEA